MSKKRKISSRPSVNFDRQVLRLAERITVGRVTTYKMLARAMGIPKASRAVGNALNRNKKLLIIPCHRVVKSDGSVGGYRLGYKKKICLLKKEGIKFEGKKVKNFSDILFNYEK